MPRWSKNKTPRARGGQRWRPDSSCWSWRRWIWPRKKARSQSALTAQMRAQHRCDCPPERPPASSPGPAMPMPCERIGEWAMSVPPVGQRRLRRSPPALRPRI
eukprot:scaffold52274_cov309-Isochrysis_galbana.AAC.1